MTRVQKTKHITTFPVRDKTIDFSNRFLAAGVREYVRGSGALFSNTSERILLHLQCHHYAKQREFFKFLCPATKHKLYKVGDSFTEELGISAVTFKKYFDGFGKRYASKKAFSAAADPFGNRLWVMVHDRKNHLTWFYRNDKLFAQLADKTARKNLLNSRLAHHKNTYATAPQHACFAKPENVVRRGLQTKNLHKSGSPGWQSYNNNSYNNISFLKREKKSHFAKVGDANFAANASENVANASSNNSVVVEKTNFTLSATSLAKNSAFPTGKAAGSSVSGPRNSDNGVNKAAGHRVVTKVWRHKTTGRRAGYRSISSANQPYTFSGRLLAIWQQETGLQEQLTTRVRRLLVRAYRGKYRSMAAWTSFCRHIGSSKLLTGRVSDFRLQLAWALHPSFSDWLQSSGVRFGDRVSTAEAAAISRRRSELQQRADRDRQRLAAFRRLPWQQRDRIWETFVDSVEAGRGSAIKAATLRSCGYDSWAVSGSGFADFLSQFVSKKGYNREKEMNHG